MNSIACERANDEGMPPKTRMIDSFPCLLLVQLRLFLKYHVRYKILLRHPTLLSLQCLAFFASPFQASSLFETRPSRIQHSKPVMGAHAFSFRPALAPHCPRVFHPAVTPKDPCSLPSFQPVFYHYSGQPRHCSRFA